MDTDKARLIESLSTRKEVKGFLDNLEKLRADGSLAEGQYNSMKSEYEQKLEAANLKILEVKGEIGFKLQELNRQMDTIRADLEAMRLRFKVEAPPGADYQKREQEINASIASMEQEAGQLRMYLAAQIPEEISTQTDEPPLSPAPDVPPVPKPAVSSTGADHSRPFISGINFKALPKRWIIIGGSACALVIMVIILAVVLAGGGGEVKVQLNLQGAAGIGALHLELAYDDELLSPVSVQQGSMASNSLFKYSINSPGGVVIGIVDSKGISGDGAIATVVFKTKSGGKASDITIENVEAWDVNFVEMGFATEPGGITAGNTVKPPALKFLK